MCIMIVYIKCHHYCYAYDSCAGKLEFMNIVSSISASAYHERRCRGSRMNISTLLFDDDVLALCALIAACISLLGTREWI